MTNGVVLRFAMGIDWRGWPKAAMLGSLDHLTRELIVPTSPTKRSSDFIAHLGQPDALYGPTPGRQAKPVVRVEDNGPIHVAAEDLTRERMVVSLAKSRSSAQCTAAAVSSHTSHHQFVPVHQAEPKPDVTSFSAAMVVCCDEVTTSMK